MTIPQVKLAILGISCPNCEQHTPETVDVLFGLEELECAHCGATIDIGSGAKRKFIEEIFLACEAVDEIDG